MNLYGPRRVSAWRRVTVPRALRTHGFVAGDWVCLRASAGVILMSRGDEQVGRRRVTTHGQVTLPATAMNAVSMVVGDFVYFMPRPDGEVQILPSGAVEAFTGQLAS